LANGHYGTRKSWRSDGARWSFDEFVLGGGRPGIHCAVHAEMLSADTMFVSVADRRFWLRFKRNGDAVITWEERDSGLSAAPPGEGDKCAG
jgi:hypothetical protein